VVKQRNYNSKTDYQTSLTLPQTIKVYQVISSYRSEHTFLFTTRGKEDLDSAYLSTVNLKLAADEKILGRNRLDNLLEHFWYSADDSSKVFYQLSVNLGNTPLRDVPEPSKTGKHPLIDL